MLVVASSSPSVKHPEKPKRSLDQQKRRGSTTTSFFYVFNDRVRAHFSTNIATNCRRKTQPAPTLVRPKALKTIPCIVYFRLGTLDPVDHQLIPISLDTPVGRRAIFVMRGSYPQLADGFVAFGFQAPDLGSHRSRHQIRATTATASTARPDFES